MNILHNPNYIVSLTVLVTCSLYYSPVFSSQLTYPDNSYSTGSSLTATELNSKFNEIKASVNDNDTSISELQNSVSELENKIPSDRFVDNGDGTISDYETGLMWEQKNFSDGVENGTNPQDVDNTYGWSQTSATYPDGTLKSGFLDKTNCEIECTSSLAGYTDWRIPTVSELRTIMNPISSCTTAPCIIDPIFLPVISDFYWTSSRTNDANFARVCNFANGGAGAYIKGASWYVRAVRRFRLTIQSQ